VRTLLDRPAESALMVKGPSFEGLDSTQARTFRQIEDAIQRQRGISFSYSKPEGHKHYPRLEPYRLINHSGVWYLAALDHGKLKAFTFTKIDRLLPSISAGASSSGRSRSRRNWKTAA
jgi:predicted DNA-binding transcriptional regulator YafY